MRIELQAIAKHRYDGHDRKPGDRYFAASERDARTLIGLRLSSECPAQQAAPAMPVQAASDAPPKRGRGRPKGSKNKPKPAGTAPTGYKRRDQRATQ